MGATGADQIRLLHIHIIRKVYAYAVLVRYLQLLDTANRIEEFLDADGRKDAFTYDSAGNMLTYSKDGVSGTITYDELNRKLSETVNYGPFSKTYSYTYDAFGNKATFTNSEGKTYTYAYDRNDQPTEPWRMAGRSGAQKGA